MAELEHEVARAVGALRSKRSPPPGAKARVHALLEAQLGDLGPDDGGVGQGEGGPAPTGVDGLFAAKVVGATAALTAGGLLVLKLGVLAVRSLMPTRASDPAPSERAEVRAEVEAVAPAEPAELPLDSPEPELVALDSDEPPEAPAVASRKPGAVAVAPGKSGPTESDISAELALIDAARRAATPEAAITELREHARRFPEGTLSDEREALWAIASCERKDFTDAAQRAEALADRRPNSPLLDRVAKACPTLEK